MSAFLEGIGKLIGKATDYIQGRSERRRNEIATMERELNEIKNKPCSLANTKRYEQLSARLSQLKREAANAAKD